MNPGTLHLVDPSLWPLLQAFPPLVLSDDTLPLIRAGVAAASAQAVAAPDGLAVTQQVQFIPGAPGEVDLRVLVLHPDGAAPQARPAILHIHGGGYVIGSPEQFQPMLRRYAAALGCVIVSVDYRLAPETRHPGPVEDCARALRWLFAQAAVLGVDRRRVALMGESAGGGLAAALAWLNRDREQLPLVLQCLRYPMLDDRTPDPVSDDPHTGEFVWTRASNAFGWASLLGPLRGAPDLPPYAAAARATDLAGLPPACISVGSLDLFLHENLAYAQRLCRAGVPVALVVYPGAFHGFDMAADAPVAQQAHRFQLEALQAAFALSAT